ncbi:MAG: nucleotidyltransferase family protein [Nitrospirota bacterium]
MPAVSFQGSTFVAMVYKDLSLRDFDDLGFIIPQHRLAAAQRVLWSQGYRPRDQSHDERDAGHTDEPYCVFVKKNSVLRVDLQWVIVHEQFAFRLDRSEVWRHRVLVSTDGQGHGS